ncbi:50S ribosomal protein L25 [Fundicoccus ignavus]|uniref:Large ribosomal subunit protein bL25 n=1 Tax=Fundicoccus ignavus TaxID=2664442 RepID=A0A844CB77_9LACT|nr:50S ribosomal protein L25 [Fundicoccus ignavus]MRJ46731.1 50S ribosomal protein L25 [Fundicoccus ignavus]
MAIKADVRKSTGTSASRKARKVGLIPVTLYGNGIETVSLTVDRREFDALLKREGANAVFDLEYDGNVQKVWIKDFAKASLQDEFYSLDLEAISKDQKLTVDVPLVLINEETLKEGIVELIANTVQVETTPDNIPSNIEIDVEGLVIGDVKTVADLSIPANVEVLDDGEQTVVTVSAPTEVPEESDEEVAEPEVIGEEETQED